MFLQNFTSTRTETHVRLKLYNVSERDTGKYSCKAHNFVGKSENSFWLMVKNPAGKHYMYTHTHHTHHTPHTHRTHHTHCTHHTHRTHHTHHTHHTHRTHMQPTPYTPHTHEAQILHTPHTVHTVHTCSTHRTHHTHHIGIHSQRLRPGRMGAHLSSRDHRQPRP